jgi:hypothetical protein
MDAVPLSAIQWADSCMLAYVYHATGPSGIPHGDNPHGLLEDGTGSATPARRYASAKFDLVEGINL